jgi:N-acyl-D-aspartate/D-glutamate deacylase
VPDKGIFKKNMATYDLVIRGGLVADGNGGIPSVQDIAIDGDKIAAVGPELAGTGAREIDAAGLLVTPGFVDIHTHYDGQATWDSTLTPSSWHGVTTTLFGNCGVGFAPVRPGKQDYLINLMEGVEDIPGGVSQTGHRVIKSHPILVYMENPYRVRK